MGEKQDINRCRTHPDYVVAFTAAKAAVENERVLLAQDFLARFSHYFPNADKPCVDDNLYAGIILYEVAHRTLTDNKFFGGDRMLIGWCADFASN